MLTTAPLLLALLLATDDDDNFRRDGDRAYLEGEPPPALMVEDWINGEPFTLEEVRGKVVLLDFWGMWTSNCRREVDRMKELWDTHRQDGLVILGVHTSTGWDKPPDFIAAHGIWFPVAHDARNETGEAYGVQAVPEYHLVDRSGVLRYADLHREDLALAVEYLLGEHSGDLTEPLTEWIEAHPQLQLEMEHEQAPVLLSDYTCLVIEVEGEACIELTTETGSGAHRESTVSVARLRDLALRSVSGQVTDTKTTSYSYEAIDGRLQGSSGEDEVNLELPADALTPSLSLLRAMVLPFEEDAHVDFTVLEPGGPSLSSPGLVRYVGQETLELDGTRQRLHVVELVEDGEPEMRLFLDDEHHLLAVTSLALDGVTLRASYPGE